MLRAKKNEPKKKGAISFWSKEKCTCPACQKQFDKEEMLSGSGRMNAGDLTDELHRNFIPTERYGEIFPIIYKIGACPNCHTALFWDDFNQIDDTASLDAIAEDAKARKAAVELIFPHYDLRHQRTLLDGAAMHYLALLCYTKVDAKYTPTAKCAILSIRLAWLCKDLNRIIPGYNYDYVSEVFYRKALFYYQQTLIKETTGDESVGTIPNLGPDIDKNYGYDGIIYLCGLLEYKYGQKDDMALRGKKLDEYKRSIARIFGLGKSSKNKPSALLEHARALYETLTKELSANNIFSEDDDEEDEESEV